MQNISRKIAALAVASALILPTTMSPAHAQSSFGSSDAGTPNITNAKADRLERELEKTDKLYGNVLDRELDSMAESQLLFAYYGAISLTGGFYEKVDGNLRTTVSRISEAQVDEYLRLAPELQKEAASRPSRLDSYFGIAVGVVDGMYLVAEMRQYPDVFVPIAK